MELQDLSLKERRKATKDNCIKSQQIELQQNLELIRQQAELVRDLKANSEDKLSDDILEQVWILLALKEKDPQWQQTQVCAVYVYSYNAVASQRSVSSCVGKC
jgi:hypothetical protein